MNTLDALLKSVHDCPHDSVRRLVYADALDEADLPVFAAVQRVIAQPDDDGLRRAYADVCPDPDRAEFVRVQLMQQTVREPEYLTVQGLHDDPASYEWGICVGCRKTRPVKCEFHTLEQRERELMEKDFTSEELVWGNQTQVHERRWKFVRGFVERVTCAGDDWVIRATHLMDTQPIRTVIINQPPTIRPRRTQRSDDDLCILGNRWHPANLVHGLAQELYDRDYGIALLHLDYPGVTFRKLGTVGVLLHGGQGGQIREIEAAEEIQVGDLVASDTQGRAIATGRSHKDYGLVIGRCVRGNDT
jgi:uncharacterized protein (TIGR02996 family)